MSVKPISPTQAKESKSSQIPEAVVECFNECIVEHLEDSGISKFTQDAVIEKICRRAGVSRYQVFERHLLDVEPLYQERGWDVEYDKPGCNESYVANFTFKPSRR